MIQFGVTEWTLDCRGIDSLYRASTLGLHVVQLGIRSKERLRALSNPAVQTAYREASLETGTKMVGLSFNLFLFIDGMTAADGTQVRQKGLDIIQRGIDVAHKLGINFLYIPAFMRAEIHTDDDLRQTAKALRYACQLAGGSDLTIGTENSLSVEDNLQLFELVNHPKLRAMIDSQNPVLWQHKTSDLITGLSEKMSNQVHLKDGTGGVMGNAPLGTGEGNVADAANALKSIGFDGYVLLENDYNEEAEARVAHDLAVLERYFG